MSGHQCINLSIDVAPPFLAFPHFCLKFLASQMGWDPCKAKLMGGRSTKNVLVCSSPCGAPPGTRNGPFAITGDVGPFWKEKGRLLDGFSLPSVHRLLITKETGNGSNPLGRVPTPFINYQPPHHGLKPMVSGGAPLASVAAKAPSGIWSGLRRTPWTSRMESPEGISLGRLGMSPKFHRQSVD